jgi:hypothetical protein
MKRTVTFEFECGDTTCVDPITQKPCKFLGSKRMGTTPVCLLFRYEDGEEIELQLSLGLTEKQWRLRCTACQLQSSRVPSIMK